jgi:3-oxoadipate enol-lactonase
MREVRVRASINGIELYYSVTGRSDALPIVFIHGFPLSHQMWNPQIETLQQKYRLIAYDIRGHGRSDAGDGQYLLEFFVDDLIGLLDHLKIDRAVLCGLSMGGYIALRAVERNPQRCRALILCDTRSEADSNEAKLKRAAAIKTVKEKGVKAFADEFIKPLFAPQTFSANPGIVESVRQMIQSNPPAGICGALLALAGRTDTTASLPKISVPTLILVGEHDGLTPPAAAEAIHARIPNSELRIIPNAGHLSNLENPQHFNRHLLEFLARLG